MKEYTTKKAGMQKKQINISYNEGKLSGKKEKNPMIPITDDEIREVEEKFKILNKKYPDLVDEVSYQDLRTVINYLLEPELLELYP